MIDNPSTPEGSNQVTEVSSEPISPDIEAVYIMTREEFESILARNASEGMPIDLYDAFFDVMKGPLNPYQLRCILNYYFLLGKKNGSDTTSWRIDFTDLILLLQKDGTLLPGRHPLHPTPEHEAVFGELFSIYGGGRSVSSPRIFFPHYCPPRRSPTGPILHTRFFQEPLNTKKKS